jgi:hypothetical protein
MMYTIVQGDCLSSIAYEHGFADWQTIYNHDKNKAFRRQCPDPNIIYPGLELYIPELTPKEETRAAGQQHVFRKKTAPVLLRVVLLDENHQPMAGAPYKLAVGESVVEGSTGPDGFLEQPVPQAAATARLSVKLNRPDGVTGYSWDLRLGMLDPQTTITGIQARLNNLGYNTGPVDGIKGPRTTEAIKEFQAKYGLTVDGIAGPITQGKLVEVYGC